eukprot:gene10933-biopygen2561
MLGKSWGASAQRGARPPGLDSPFILHIIADIPNAPALGQEGPARCQPPLPITHRQRQRKSLRQRQRQKQDSKSMNDCGSTPAAMLIPVGLTSFACPAVDLRKRMPAGRSGKSPPAEDSAQNAKAERVEGWRTRVSGSEWGGSGVLLWDVTAAES